MPVNFLSLTQLSVIVGIRTHFLYFRQEFLPTSVIRIIQREKIDRETNGIQL